jgi:hypothetical protein|tara:strand:- start:903 stop:1463 length:561 start_codon:yes stop_codon:yes gene_type:complete
MEKKEVKWSKLFILGLGGVIGLSHLGMIGALMNRESKLPSINVPVGPYTSYNAEVGRDGYKISYRANDPKVMHVERDINTKGGFLGLANNKTKISEQYTMDGAVHTKPITSTEGTTNGKSEACIKAIGGAEGTGRLVGSSIGASAAPTLSNIPFIGWVAAGWVTMFSGNQGAEIGGSMAEDLNKNC